MKRVYFALVLTIIVMGIAGIYIYQSAVVSEEMETTLWEIFEITEQEETANLASARYNTLHTKWGEQRLRWLVIFGKYSVFEFEECLDALRMALDHEEWQDARLEALHCIGKLEEIWSYQRIDYVNLF